MENIGMSIVYFIIGMGCFYFLKGSEFEKEEGGYIGYIIALAFGSIAWLALFTGGMTGLTGYINFVIIGVVMLIFHFIIRFFK